MLPILDRLKRDRTKCLRLAAILGLAAAAAGCSTYQTEVGDSYSGSALTQQGGAAGIPIQVDGSVGGKRGAPLASAVAAAMPASIDGSSVHYAPCEPYTECSGDHVVWTFGPLAARSSTNYPSELHLNVDWIGDYTPSPNRVTALVAVFQGNNVVARASGQVDAPQGADDPAFKALIDEMSREVFAGPPLLDGVF